MGWDRRSVLAAGAGLLAGCNGRVDETATRTVTPADVPVRREEVLTTAADIQVPHIRTPAIISDAHRDEVVRLVLARIRAAEEASRPPTALPSPTSKGSRTPRRHSRPPAGTCSPTGRRSPRAALRSSRHDSGTSGPSAATSGPRPAGSVPTRCGRDTGPSSNGTAPSPTGSSSDS